MKEIPLTQGKVALVDDGDYECLAALKWYANRTGETFYARRHGTSSRHEKIYMHREILNAPPGLEVDHISGDGLDNRRDNLRLATKSDNQHNAGKRKDNTSGYKGVYFDKQSGCWKAKIQVNGAFRHIGYFDTPEAAAQAYDDAARELHGEFARTNFTEEKTR